ncbi:13664_t:CDS:2 [Rhizophagus irregularis]|nr:13664_t:CDS:2 [Rhizophagus irregularis]
MVLQILLVQIDCAIILNANGELTDSIRHEYNQMSNFNKWINFSFDELNAHIKNKKVVKQSNYSSTTKRRTLLKEVEEHGIKVGCWTVIDICTLAVRWITFNLAGSTIRFLQKVRNYSENSCNLLEINTSNFYESISKWRCIYDYMEPTICAKDQTKIAEMIEVEHRRIQFS